MKKFIIKSEEEYRQHAFKRCDQSDRLDGSYGFKMIRECYYFDEHGNDIDEHGNIIPPNTPENVELDDFVKNFTYPLMILEWIENVSDRLGDCQIICVEFVELKEFYDSV